ncbi:hypothetical protein [Actinomadura sp. 9N215]
MVGSIQDSVINWVAIHHRHYAFTDRLATPAPPYRYGTGLRRDRCPVGR